MAVDVQIETVIDRPVAVAPVRQMGVGTVDTPSMDPVVVTGCDRWGSYRDGVRLGPSSLPCSEQWRSGQWSRLPSCSSTTAGPRFRPLRCLPLSIQATRSGLGRSI